MRTDRMRTRSRMEDPTGKMHSEYIEGAVYTSRNWEEQPCILQ